MLFSYKEKFLIKAQIIKIESKDYYVNLDGDKVVRCNLRGKFKKQFELKKDKQFILDVATIGDNVEIDLNEDGTGTIYEIYERKNQISRKAPKIKGASFRGERLEQIIAANVDNLVIVMSTFDPLFNNKLLDRILVVAESSHVHPKIVINKIDLDLPDLDFWIDLYSSIGYDVLPTSVKENTGLASLRNELDNKISVFWGASGVGKSSILNMLYPGLDLKVGEISQASRKGKHTTVTSVMKNVSSGTFIIDTPGIREIDPYGIKKEDLGHYFIEFEDYIHDCRFNTCTHHHEPQCAVIEAVENEEISVERYDSYLSLLDSIEDDMNF